MSAFVIISSIIIALVIPAAAVVWFAKHYEN